MDASDIQAASEPRSDAGRLDDPRIMPKAAGVNPDFRLQRFVVAQDEDGIYPRAVRELQAGRKQSHWMWFIFPQIAGLGRSPMAQLYAISGLAEAQAYLRHPVLGPRLLECANLLTTITGRSAEQIFGAVDALEAALVDDVVRAGRTPGTGVPGRAGPVLRGPGRRRDDVPTVTAAACLRAGSSDATAPGIPDRHRPARLRPLTTADVDELLTYRGRADVCRYLPFEPMTPEVLLGRLRTDLSRTAITLEGQALTLGVELAETGRLIGDLVLFFRSREHAGGELGYVFHPDVAGQGYATEAARAMLDLAFGQFGPAPGGRPARCPERTVGEAGRPAGHAPGGPFRPQRDLQGRVVRRADLRHPGFGMGLALAPADGPDHITFLAYLDLFNAFQKFFWDNDSIFCNSSLHTYLILLVFVRNPI